jgi:FKBP-type peptidyl-prolyl cis-trans isomerase
MQRFVFLFAALVAAASCNNEITGLEPPSDPATETFDPSLNVNISQMTRLPGGTYIRDLTLGTGDSVKATTDTIVYSYSLHLKTGTLVETGTNVKSLLPGVIAGFRAGLIDMREGGRRQIVIPSEQGYGAISQPGPDGKIRVPRQSTLIFDVSLIRVNTPAPPTPPTP